MLRPRLGAILVESGSAIVDGQDHVGRGADAKDGVGDGHAQASFFLGTVPYRVVARIRNNPSLPR